MDREKLKEVRKKLKVVLEKYNLTEKLDQLVELIDTYSKHPAKDAPTMREIDKALETLSNKAKSKRELLQTVIQPEWFSYTSHTHCIVDEPDIGEPDKSEWEQSIARIVDTLIELEQQIAVAKHLRPEVKASPPGRGPEGAFILNVKILLQDIDCSLEVLRIANVFLNLSLPSDESLKRTLKTIGDGRRDEPSHPIDTIPDYRIIRYKEKSETWSTASTEPWHKGLAEHARELKDEGLTYETIAQELNISIPRLRRMLSK